MTVMKPSSQKATPFNTEKNWTFSPFLTKKGRVWAFYRVPYEILAIVIFNDFLKNYVFLYSHQQKNSIISQAKNPQLP